MSNASNGFRSVLQLLSLDFVRFFRFGRFASISSGPMMLSSRSFLFILLGTVAPVIGAECNSFGIDFVDSSSYFQNSLSSDPFTFVQEFGGDCKGDISQNLLVDPAGNQTQCSDTNILPINTAQLSTCPIKKSSPELRSGPWSILVLSNNADGESFAWQRDFQLEVGPQQTQTITPTVTVSSTITPQVNSTSLVTDISTTQAAAPTVVQPSITRTPLATTITPSRVTSTTTKILRTTTINKPQLVVTKVTKTIQPSCSVPPRRTRKDHRASIRPTLARAAALATIVSSGTGASITSNGTARRLNRRELADDLPAWLAKRDAYLSGAGAQAHIIVKRAPDLPTVTQTETRTESFSTTTQTINAPAVTNTIHETTQITTTVTPPAITVVEGTTVLPKQTVTAPTPTRIITKYTIVSSTRTTTYRQT